MSSDFKMKDNLEIEVIVRGEEPQIYTVHNDVTNYGKQRLIMAAVGLNPSTIASFWYVGQNASSTNPSQIALITPTVASITPVFGTNSDGNTVASATVGEDTANGYTFRDIQFLMKEPAGYFSVTQWVFSRATYSGITKNNLTTVNFTWNFNWRSP